MYVGKLKLLFHPEIDKPILLNSPIQADLLVILILCGAHALNYINATGRKLTSINIVSQRVTIRNFEKSLALAAVRYVRIEKA